jgi:hypothetical protein
MFKSGYCIRFHSPKGKLFSKIAWVLACQFPAVWLVYDILPKINHNPVFLSGLFILLLFSLLLAVVGFMSYIYAMYKEKQWFDQKSQKRVTELEQQNSSEKIIALVDKFKAEKLL